MRKHYETRNKMMGGGMMKKRTMMKKGGLKMVSKNGKKVPFFAADGKGAKDLGKAKMMKGGRVKKMGGGMTREMYSKGSNGKKKDKKKAFGMLSVKAGIDKNPKPTQADRIAGAKMRNKGKKA